MAQWADLNSGKPAGSDAADVSIIAGRIDNLVKALNGTDYLSAIDINGGSIDGTPIGAASPSTASFTTATVDNINIDGNTIISTNTNGDINITPNGTGSIVQSKVDINGGAIDGTPIGANSASTGAFTTISGTTVTCTSIATGGNSAIKMKSLTASIDAASGTTNLAHGLTVGNIVGHTWPSFTDSHYYCANIASNTPFVQGANIVVDWVDNGGGGSPGTTLGVVVFYV